MKLKKGQKAYVGKRIYKEGETLPEDVFPKKKEKVIVEKTEELKELK